MCQNSIRNQFSNILRKANFIPETSLFAFPFCWKKLEFDIHVKGKSSWDVENNQTPKWF